jgi:Polyphosphate kinase 2 (PPK2)
MEATELGSLMLSTCIVGTLLYSTDSPLKYLPYSERELWPNYIEAFEEAMEKTSTKHAPWYVIPSNHKWFRNLAISEIVADTMEDMDLKLPPAQVDIAEIRRKYHAAAQEQEQRGHKSPKASQKK